MKSPPTLPLDFPTLLPARKVRVSQAIQDWRYVDGLLAARTRQEAAYARGSAGTARDAYGRIRACVADQPRWEMLDLDADDVFETMGLLLEGARTQFLTSPSAPATQTQSLAAGTYTCWIVGSGSLTLSGGATGVVTEGEWVTFTLGATVNVTFTVAGTVTRFQCENSSAPTSFIPGASRSADVLTYPHLALPGVSTIYTRFIDRGIRAAGAANLGVWAIGSAAAAAEAFALFGSANGYTFRHVGGTTQSVEVETDDTYELHVETRAVINANGSILLGISVDREAEVVEENAAANALDTEYSAELLHMGIWATNKSGNLVLLEHRHLPGVHSLAAIRSPV